MYLRVHGFQTALLTPILSSKEALGVMGMGPPALPNIFSNDCCTLSGNVSQHVVATAHEVFHSRT